MTYFDYYFHHCWIGGWRQIAGTFRIWRDLMTSNYANYSLLHEDDPYEECLGWLWASLGEDETLPKDFIEHLQQIIQNVHGGGERLKSFGGTSNPVKLGEAFRKVSSSPRLTQNQAIYGCDVAITDELEGTC